MKTLIILKGASGSGKSTVAKLFKDAVICTADDYFVDEEGNYNFNPDKLREAHDACYNKFLVAVNYEAETIVIANTNTTSKEWFRYFDHASEYGYQTHHLIVENRHGNDSVHGTPQHVRNRQAERIIQNIKLI